MASTKKKHYDLLIIGGGPSGINCAIEAKKHGLTYTILEKGVLVNSLYHFPTNMTFFSTSVKLEIGDIPFISHTDKPTRKEALEYYRRVVQSYQLNICYSQEVLGMSKSETLYTVETAKDTFTAKSVILATGFYGNPIPLNVTGEALPKVKHYYDEAHPYIDRNIVVIGGANSACDVALETWQKGAHVTMVVRSPQLYEKVKYWILPNIENRIAEGSIKAYFDSQVTSISADSVTINCPEGEIQIPNDYVLAMTGYTPDYTLLQKLGIEIGLDQYLTPTHNPDTLQSNLPGVYITGVLLGGLHTSKYYIENTRDQAELILQQITQHMV